MTDATLQYNENTSATVERLQEDVNAMREDMTKLSQQVVDLLAARGSSAYRRAKSKFDEQTGEAKEAVRDVRDTFMGAIEESVQERPLATLAMALGIGFIIGVTWRR
jgi:ElaB/YqjD/DUF883 family membrane-anchored ribosome-binding protein